MGHLAAGLATLQLVEALLLVPGAEAEVAPVVAALELVVAVLLVPGAEAEVAPVVAVPFASCR